MIKIIGKDASQVKQITCRTCASILEYVLADLKQDYSTDYTGSKDYYTYIDCPCCQKQVVTKYN